MLKLNSNSQLAFATLAAGTLIAAAMAPIAGAAPTDCSRESVNATVQSVLGVARGYLNAHPGADQAVSAVYTQPREAAAANIRTYFTANPQEYFELKAILAPIGDTQRACNVAVLSPEMASAYDEFMAG